MSSREAAAGRAESTEPPNASQLAIHTAGRNRLPPAKVEYRTAS